MWRAVWQRLGFGYIVMLPALAYFGVAVHSTLEVFVFELDTMLQEVTGRRIADLNNLHIKILWWLTCNPPSILILFLLPWWAGAWTLLRPAEAATPDDYWRIVFAVSNTVIAVLGFIVWCCAIFMRSFYLMDYVSSERSPLTDGMTILLGCLILFAFVAAFRLRPKRPGKA